jgi:hypothetical protein
MELVAPQEYNRLARLVSPPKRRDRHDKAASGAYRAALSLQSPRGEEGLDFHRALLFTLSIVWVPLALAAFLPGASTNYLPRFGAWLNRNDRWIQVALGTGFGIFLAVKGIRGL